jgi:hypothetical protein
MISIDTKTTAACSLLLFFLLSPPRSRPPAARSCALHGSLALAVQLPCLYPPRPIALLSACFVAPLFASACPPPSSVRSTHSDAPPALAANPRPRPRPRAHALPAHRPPPRPPRPAAAAPSGARPPRPPRPPLPRPPPAPAAPAGVAHPKGISGPVNTTSVTLSDSAHCTKVCPPPALTRAHSASSCCAAATSLCSVWLKFCPKAAARGGREGVSWGHRACGQVGSGARGPAGHGGGAHTT